MHASSARIERIVSAPRFTRFTLLIITLLGFGVRILALGKPSLWLDETFSFSLSNMAYSFQALVDVLVRDDLHPFLYYLILYRHRLLAGDSEFSLRFLSVLFGVLLIPTMYAIARELFSGRAGARSVSTAVGLTVAALVAFSPFLVRYSREVRGYMLSALLIALAILALLRAVRLGGRWWIVYATLVVLSWYTHYFAIFAVPAFFFYAVLMGRRTFLSWLGATGLSVGLFLPWVEPMFLQIRRLMAAPDFFPGQLSPWQVVEDLARILLPEPEWGALLDVFLVIVGLVASMFILIRRDELVKRAALIFLAWMVPVALTAVAVTFVPKFAPRYMITAVPLLILSLALGLFLLLWRWPRIGRAIYVAVTAVAIVLSLGQTVYAAARGELAEGDDPRSLARFLKERTGPDDVLLLAGNPPYVFRYYDPGSAHVISLYIGTNLADGAQVINQLLTTHPRHIWLILWQQAWADPGDFAATELLRRGRTITVTESFASYKVWGFEMLDYSPIVLQPTPQFPLDADFGDVASVVGYDVVDHNPGVLHVISYWRKNRPGSSRYIATFTLEDEYGYSYASGTQPLATWDYPPSAWPPDEVVRVRIDVPLPPYLLPGTYHAWLSVWDTKAKGYLPITRATSPTRERRVQLADLSLTKAQLGNASLAIPYALEHTFGGGLRLLGYDLNQTRALPGDPLMLALWWQANSDAQQALAPHDTVQVRLRAPDGRVVYSDERPLSDMYPPARWSPGEINRAAYLLRLPVELEGGSYALEVGVAGEWLKLADVTITLQPRRFDLPPDARPVDARFGGLARLAGYRLEPEVMVPGQPLTVTLYWRVEEGTQVSYHVTAQLMRDGEKIAQHDGIPAGGTRPTTSWLPGEVVADAHPIIVPTDLPEGQYAILVAIYRDDERLPVGPDTDFVLLPVLR